MAKSYNDPIECVVNIHNPPEGVYPIGFKVYYTDKTVFCGKGEDLLSQWRKAPEENVQVLVIFESSKSAVGYNTRHMMSTHDYYSYDGTTFYGANDTRAVAGHILYGKWTTDDLFEEIRTYAFNDRILGERGLSSWA